MFEKLKDIFLGRDPFDDDGPEMDAQQLKEEQRRNKIKKQSEYVKLPRKDNREDYILEGVFKMMKEEDQMSPDEIMDFLSIDEERFHRDEIKEMIEEL